VQHLSHTSSSGENQAVEASTVKSLVSASSFSGRDNFDPSEGRPIGIQVTRADDISTLQTDQIQDA